MEDTFISWLDSSGFPIGTIIAIIIGGITLISGVIVAIVKFKKAYDKKIQEKMLKTQEEKSLKKTIDDLSSLIKDIHVSVVNMATQQEQNQRDISNKLDDVWDAILESQKDSKEGDKALEAQLNSYSISLSDLNLKVTAMDEKTNLLIESDKEGIKSYITDKYYAAIDKCYIPIHDLDTIELRYQKYLDENGNTYIAAIMDKLRKLPNEKPTVHDKKEETE